MDTDGSVDSWGRMEFTSTSRRLAEDVQFLVQSLGGKVRLCPKTGIRYTSPWQPVPTAARDAFVLRNLRFGDQSIIPFTLRRKVERVRVRPHLRGWGIVSVTPVGREETVCISVDASSQMYLTDHFIPTHNTNVAGGADGGGVYLKRRSPNQGISFRIAGYGCPEEIGTQAELEKEWWEMPIPAEELQKIQKQAVDALQSSPGQAAQIQATIAGVEQAISGIGSNQVFVRQVGTPQVYMVTGLGLLHVPSFTHFKLYGGDDPSAKTIMLPKESAIWTDHHIYGQQPGDNPDATS